MLGHLPGTDASSLGDKLTAPVLFLGRPGPFFRSFDTSALETGGQRMWGDLLVASGMMLPALVYGAVLFVNYLQ
jgi:hypothetical protein